MRKCATVSTEKTSCQRSGRDLGSCSSERCSALVVVSVLCIPVFVVNIIESLDFHAIERSRVGGVSSSTLVESVACCRAVWDSRDS